VHKQAVQLYCSILRGLIVCIWGTAEYLPKIKHYSFVMFVQETGNDMGL